MSKEAVIDALESMTVVELNQLVKELEDRWGVSAAAVAPVAVAAAGGGQAAAEEGSSAAEKTSFDVHLKEIGDNKLEVIKRVKDILGIGIKEAKAVVDEVPKALKTGVGKDEAEEIKNKLVDAGAVVEIK
ncbi:MAG: 50S ribosomal protein L7/L12 [bacterium]|jgi:large subunit ribosomal protein L7/L12